MRHFIKSSCLEETRKFGDLDLDAGTSFVTTVQLAASTREILQMKRELKRFHG